MCCILYYIYLKCKDYFEKEPKQEENKTEENKKVSKQQPTLQELAEYRYNAKQINDFVRNKQRSYFINYD